MTPQNSPFDHHFAKLMDLKDTGEEEVLFAEMLRQGDQIVIPLGKFLTTCLDRPEASILVELLGKSMSRDAIPILIELLSVELAELRRAAANGLGWNRAVQALERLDRSEAEDPDPGVRVEARTAIEEILRDFPKERETLKNHTPPEESEANDPSVPADYDEIPTGQPDAEQRIELMAALPRLLALKYRALPLHFSPNGKLHLAVAMNSDRFILAALADLTGHSVELQKWSPDAIRKGIGQLYTLGDDDFCTFHDKLTPLAKAEVIEVVLQGVNPGEPGPSLDEANDAVEAVQTFLSACCRMRVVEALLQLTPPKMIVTLFRQEETVADLTPPEPKLRERFFEALRILASLEPAPGLSDQEGGLIRLIFCDPKYLVTVASEKSLNGEKMTLGFKAAEED